MLFYILPPGVFLTIPIMNHQGQLLKTQFHVQYLVNRGGIDVQSTAPSLIWGPTPKDHRYLPSTGNRWLPISFIFRFEYLVYKLYVHFKIHSSLGYRKFMVYSAIKSENSGRTIILPSNSLLTSSIVFL